jgi:phosphoribosylanthranilate isomerase
MVARVSYGTVRNAFMRPIYTPRVKICCILNVQEAWLAIEHGASALGLVSAMPSGPGVIDEGRIAAIAAQLPPAIGSFLLTSLQESTAIVEQQRRCCTNTLQLVDSIPLDDYARIRAALPGISIVQVIHVIDETNVAEALRVAPHVDGLLLDSGNPSLSIKQLGGTGRVHNWELSRAIREAVDVPVFLAGGLHPDNITRAIVDVGPFGVDVCSGVRTNGLLDPGKLTAFFAAIHALNAD